MALLPVGCDCRSLTRSPGGVQAAAQQRDINGLSAARSAPPATVGIVIAGWDARLAAVPGTVAFNSQLLCVKRAPCDHSAGLCRRDRVCLSPPIISLSTSSKKRDWKSRHLRSGFAWPVARLQASRSAIAGNSRDPQVGASTAPGSADVCRRSPGLSPPPPSLTPAMACRTDTVQRCRSCRSVLPTPPAATRRRCRHPSLRPAPSHGRRHAAEPAVHKGGSGPGPHLPGGLLWMAGMDHAPQSGLQRLHPPCHAHAACHPPPLPCPALPTRRLGVLTRSSPRAPTNAAQLPPGRFRCREERVPAGAADQGGTGCGAHQGGRPAMPCCFTYHTRHSIVR